MDKKNAVVVGYGCIAPVHTDVLERCENAILYGICDCDTERLEMAKEKYDCKLYSSYDDVLADKDVDVVHICTPHYLHAEMIIKAVECGKYVVVEKPVAISFDEINRVRKICKGREKNVCAILQNRFNACVKEMKRIIDSKEYGKVICGKTALTWHRTPEYYARGEWRGKWATEGGGVVVNQAIHVLDLTEYLGGRFDEVEASIHNRTLKDCIEVEDTAEAIITTKDGARIVFYATNGYAKDSQFDIEIEFEKAKLRYIYGSLYLVKDNEMKFIVKDERKKVIGKAYWGSSHDELINRFYASLNGSESYYTTITDGLDAARLALSIYQSVKENEKIKID